MTSIPRSQPTPEGSGAPKGQLLPHSSVQLTSSQPITFTSVDARAGSRAGFEQGEQSEGLRSPCHGAQCKGYACELGLDRPGDNPGFDLLETDFTLLSLASLISFTRSTRRIIPNPSFEKGNIYRCFQALRPVL